METRTITSYETKQSKRGPYYEIELDNGTKGLCFHKLTPNLVGVPVKVDYRQKDDTTFINIDDKFIKETHAVPAAETKSKDKNTSVETMCLSYLKDITVSMIDAKMFDTKDQVSEFLGGEFKNIYSFFVNMVRNQD